MKTIKLAVLALVLAPSLAMAEIKIAVIDPIGAIAETTEVKTRTGKLETDMKNKEAEMMKLRDEILAIEESLKKDGLTMSKDKQKSLSDQRDAKMNDFRSRQQLAQKRIESDRNEMLQLMEPRLKQAVDEIAKEGKYDLVLTRQAALFAKEEIDITRKVTQKMNQMK
ncbi:MAG: OmpH family outer membrane protein [Gammaproteobacteria bacterium]|jgi:outer membrane protein|nr:OmpH family outer membrane protein [Gammaproteobacteria bacterium]MBQ0775473.1 OmpH family outer membrane protein [Gammaproteobacteria bacterium]|tara:strand:- start:31564 stop:32064 length:501 start_codon:yes stop_codon:yes gene_type:complete